MEHDNYVDFYTHGVVRMNVHFPHGKADCRHCRFCRYREPFNLYQCSLTDEYIEKAELEERNQFCPIEIEETPF
jgi:hypothetical protein